MAEKLRGILVGLGGRGGHWYHSGTRHPDVEWVGYVEVSPKTRERALSEWQLDPGSVFSTLEEAVVAVKADFVMDVTPPAVHEAVCNTASDAGLHLIGEKPMSDDFEAARRMVARSKAAGIRHMITQNYRFGPQPRTTRRLVSEGIVGPVGQVDIVFYMCWADNPGSHYVTQPYMFTKDMGVHHFDMLRYVLDRNPVAVQCSTWNPSWGWHAGDGSHVAVFDFGDGIHAVHRGVGCAVGTLTGWNGDWRIEGPGGSITWEGDEIWLTHLHRANPRRRERFFPDNTGSGGVDPLLTEFAAAIREGREPECAAGDNIQSLAMVAGAVRSAMDGGRRVEIAELFRS